VTVADQRWTREPWDRDPRFDPQDSQLPAPTVDGRLRQIELALSELLSGGTDRFRITIWEKNPASGVRNPHFDAFAVTDDDTTLRSRLN
jgi:hypothetical protein